jgi:hypothetical protein
MIAHVPMLIDRWTRAYTARRTAAGNSRKEIMRPLQRYIARELDALIIEALGAAAIELTQGHQRSD